MRGSRYYTVRLAQRETGVSVVYTNVLAQDADHAAALAVGNAEKDTGRGPFVLDGPVELIDESGRIQ